MGKGYKKNPQCQWDKYKWFHSNSLSLHYNVLNVINAIERKKCKGVTSYFELEIGSQFIDSRYSSQCKENFGVGPNALFTWWKTWNMHQTNINIQVTNVCSTRKPRTRTNLDFCRKNKSIFWNPYLHSN